MFKSGYGKFESYETLNPSISKLSRNMSSTTGSSYMKFRQTLQTNKENYLSYSNLSSKGSKF